MHELAGIAKKYEGKKCVLFEKVKGSAYPVFMGLLWNRDTVGALFNVPKEQVPFVIGAAIGSWRKDKEAFAPKVLEKGPANEVVVTRNVNLYDLPVPVHALKDGGAYFDSSVVVVNDPETGLAQHLHPPGHDHRQGPGVVPDRSRPAPRRLSRCRWKRRGSRCR